MHAPMSPLPDLQLLAALDVLVAEGHVSRAAERLGVSQPAMSGLLARLRKTFGDPLLLRTARGMVATPRAVELAAKAAELLAQARALMVDARTFVPVSEQRTFRIIATDYVLMVVLPALQARLEAEAPGIAVEARPIMLTYSSLDQYWEIMTALAAPLRAALASLSPEKIAQLKARVFESLAPYMDGAAVKLAAVPLCASAVR